MDAKPSSDPAGAHGRASPAAAESAAAAADAQAPQPLQPQPLGFRKLSRDPCYPAYAEALACA
jgi:hypothetical protein